MYIGYARVSRKEQDLDLQRDALNQAECDRVYWEKVSSRNEDRPELALALDYCREGDVLVVWKLDRLGRSLKELIEIVNRLSERGVGFRSLQESLDTTTAGGTFIFHVFGALAELERELIRERTMAGLEAARARGRRGGRRKVMDEQRVQLARKLMADGNYSVAEMCRIVGVSSSTLYRYASPNREERMNKATAG